MYTITDYLKQLENDLKAGNATEHTHRPALKSLLESLVTGVTATNEPRRVADPSQVGLFNFSKV